MLKFWDRPKRNGTALSIILGAQAFCGVSYGQTAQEAVAAMLFGASKNSIPNGCQISDLSKINNIRHSNEKFDFSILMECQDKETLPSYDFVGISRINDCSYKFQRTAVVDLASQTGRPKSGYSVTDFMGRVDFKDIYLKPLADTKQSNEPLESIVMIEFTNTYRAVFSILYPSGNRNDQFLSTSETRDALRIMDSEFSEGKERRRLLSEATRFFVATACRGREF